MEKITISLENNDSDDNPKKEKPNNNLMQETVKNDNLILNNQNKTDFEDIIDKKIEKIEDLDINLVTSELPKDLKYTIEDNKDSIISVNEDSNNSESNNIIDLSNINHIKEINKNNISSTKINRITRKKIYFR